MTRSKRTHKGKKEDIYSQKSLMFPDDICPFCGAESNQLNLKQTEWEYRRWHCEKCHNYFSIQPGENGLEITKIGKVKT